MTLETGSGNKSLSRYCPKITSACCMDPNISKNLIFLKYGQVGSLTNTMLIDNIKINCIKNEWFFGLWPKTRSRQPWNLWNIFSFFSITKIDLLWLEITCWLIISTIINLKINSLPILAEKFCLSFSGLKIYKDNYFHLSSTYIWEKVIKVLQPTSFYIVLFKINHKKMIIIYNKISNISHLFEVQCFTISKQSYHVKYSHQWAQIVLTKCSNQLMCLDTRCFPKPIHCLHCKDCHCSLLKSFIP